MNIKLFRWTRCLQLVKKFKVHADTLLGNLPPSPQFKSNFLLAYRERYLKQMNMDETNESFFSLAKHVGEVDWDKIKAAAKEEKAREKDL